MASAPPMELGTQDHHWECTNGNTSCGGSILMWTEESRWETSYSGLDASMRGGCRPAGGPWRKDTRMRGMSPKILVRFITEECNHSWRWGVMVPVFTSQEGCPGQRGLVCSVSPQRTELG